MHLNACVHYHVYATAMTAAGQHSCWRKYETFDTMAQALDCGRGLFLSNKFKSVEIHQVSSVPQVAGADAGDAGWKNIPIKIFGDSTFYSPFSRAAQAVVLLLALSLFYAGLTAFAAYYFLS